MLSLQMIQDLFILVDFNSDFGFCLPRKSARFMKVCFLVILIGFAEILAALLLASIECLLSKVRIFCCMLFWMLALLLSRFIELVLRRCKILLPFLLV